MLFAPQDRIFDKRYEETIATQEHLAKEDMYRVFDMAPKEVTGLLKALDAGQINGTIYVGKCCCLKGTLGRLARLREGILDLNWVDGPETGIIEDYIRERFQTLNPSEPAESWFLKIKPGDTPNNNPYAKDVKEWTLEWLEGKGLLK